MVAGSASSLNGFALARFNSNGSLDTGFDTDGILSTVIGTSSQATSLVIQPDNKIWQEDLLLYPAHRILHWHGITAMAVWIPGLGVVARRPHQLAAPVTGLMPWLDKSMAKLSWRGMPQAHRHPMTLRLLDLIATAGTDTSYGSAGTVITPIGATQDIAYAIALQADGKAVVVGYLDNPLYRDSVLARYLGDQPTAVPTLSEWGIIIFMVLSGISAIYCMRRQRRSES